MKKYIIGALVGSALTVSATAGAAVVKQYVLTEVAYPVVVNGQEFKDVSAPILNYEGSTYVPLAKLGDLTGVNYKWNEAEKRVEIVTSGTTTSSSKPTSTKTAPENSGMLEEVIMSTRDVSKDPYPVEPPTPTGNRYIDRQLADIYEQRVRPPQKTEVVKPKGWVLENGEYVLYAYDKEDNYKGKFTDNGDAETLIANIEKRTEFPPTINQGFLGLGDLAKIYDSADIYWDGDTLILKTSPTVFKEKEYLRMTLPNNWKEDDDGLFKTIDGIGVSDYRVNRGISGEWVDVKDTEKVNLRSYLGFDELMISIGSKKVFDAKLPAKWESKADNEEVTVKGLRVKREKGVNYIKTEDLIRLNLFVPKDFISHSIFLTISDLQKAGIIK